MKPAVSRTCALGHNPSRPSAHLASSNVPSATHRRGKPAPLLPQVRIAVQGRAAIAYTHVTMRQMQSAAGAAGAGPVH